VPFVTHDQLTPEDVKVLELVNASLERLRGVKRDYMVPMKFRLTWALESFLQYGIHRMVTLGDGMAAEWNEQRYLNSAVLARHLIETVAAWYRLLNQIHANLLPDKQIRKIFVLVMQALFGRKDGDPVLPQATNVLTCIKHLKEVLPQIGSVYDQLSEFAHPNSDGHLTFGGTMDERTGFMWLGGAGKDDGLQSLTLGAAGCLHFAARFFEGYEENIKERMEALELEFGNLVAEWPGDPSITWRRS
jgi:hypothetical protein